MSVIPIGAKVDERRQFETAALIVIPGGTSGIGLATARILVGWGHQVVVGGRRRVHNRDPVDGESAGLLRIRSLDVCNQDSVDRFFEAIESEEKSPRVLINCFGLMKLSPFQELKRGEWEEMVNTNVLGLLRCTAGILPLFQRSGGGKIINIGSVAGHKVATPDGTVYSATKFAVAALSEGMRQELAELNISVTLVSPGATKTQLGQNSSNQESKDRISKYYATYGMKAEDVAEQIAAIAVADSTANVSEVVLRSLHHRF
jgi:NADP-dependent 3-hydroxy acid dehydrogenase YdfG